MDQLKRLINEAAARRAVLEQTVADRGRQLARSERRLRFAQLFIVRVAMQRRIPILARTAFDARQSLDEAQDELGGCVIDVDVGLDRAALNKFERLRETYDVLRQSAAIWDITSSVAIDQRVERTTATNAISRSPVRFDFAQSALIASKYQALRLGNANGQDIHVYPGFVMLHNPGQDFAVIDVRDLDVRFGASRYIEGETVPADASVVGHTWARANKDGSRDRRFSDNYQIPVVLYGRLDLVSPTGLTEAYQVSSYENAQVFAASFADFQTAVSQTAVSGEASLTSPEQESVPDDEPALNSESFVPPPPAKNLAFDWVAAAGILLLMVWAGFTAPNWVGVMAQQFSSITFQQSASPNPQKIQAPQAGQAAVREIVYALNSNSNIRAAPSLSGAVVRKTTRNERFNVFARSDEWIQIGDMTPIGWIRGDLVALNPTPQP